VYTGSASHQEAVQRRVSGQGHQELKLISHWSVLAARQHDLGYLLVKVLLTMHYVQSKQVPVKAHRCVQIGYRDTDMIKTE
jgi:hypothetical protein